MAENAEILLAADVIYDHDLTSAFFKTVHKFLSVPPSKSLYLALERRLNFTLTDLEVSCPAYQYFTQCLSNLCTQNNQSNISYTVEQINPQSFGQYFNYHRTKYLELCKVTSFVTDKWLIEQYQWVEKKSCIELDFFIFYFWAIENWHIL